MTKCSGVAWDIILLIQGFSLDKNWLQKSEIHLEQILIAYLLNKYEDGLKNIPKEFFNQWAIGNTEPVFVYTENDNLPLCKFAFMLRTLQTTEYIKLCLSMFQNEIYHPSRNYGPYQVIEAEGIKCEPKFIDVLKNLPVCSKQPPYVMIDKLKHLNPLEFPIAHPNHKLNYYLYFIPTNVDVQRSKKYSIAYNLDAVADFLLKMNINNEFLLFKTQFETQLLFKT